MDDQALISELADLGIDRHCPHMMALWPFVEVAWNDKRIGAGDRERVTQLVASRRGLGRSGVRTLQGWMGFRPSGRYLARGHRAARQLIDRHGEDGPVDVISIAGVLAMAAAELFDADMVQVPREALQAVAELLHVDPDTPWSRVDIQLDETVVMRAPLLDVDTGEIDVPEVFREQLRQHRAKAKRQKGIPTLVRHGVVDQRYPLEGDVLTVGRGADNDIVLATDVRASRHHCRLELRGDHTFIVDQDSANGTHVDGQFVVEAELLGGERIAVGDTEFTFERTAR